MSTNDKAKEKLMASMRMTKAGTDANSEKTETKASPAPQESKPAKKKKESAPAKQVAKDTKSSPATYIEPSRRIWPD